jgi:AcrR family transcriptional regulator
VDRIPSAETKARRRQEIMAASLRVIAAEGFAAATMRDIADAVGTQAGALYHYFRSKHEILYVLLRDYYTQGVAETRDVVSQDRPASEVLPETATMLVRYALARPMETRILLNDWNLLCKLPEFDFIERDATAVEKLWLDLLERGIDEGSIRSDVDPTIIFRTISGAVTSVLRWYEPGGPVDADTVVAQQVEFFVEGLRGR